MSLVQILINSDLTQTGRRGGECQFLHSAHVQLRGNSIS